MKHWEMAMVSGELRCASSILAASNSSKLLDNMFKSERGNMFLTLNQALKESPVGMAIVEFPYKDVVKLCADGSTKIIMNKSDGRMCLIQGTSEGLDRTNRILVLKGINCRPVYE